MDLNGCRGHPGASVLLSSTCADINHFDLAPAGECTTEVTLSREDSNNLLASKISDFDQASLLCDFLFNTE
jgi:hypothetical protein